MIDNKYQFQSALYDFRQARQQATLGEVLARLRGLSPLLLSYEEVRQKLKVLKSGEKTLKDIPLAAIIGSLNRYEDFTRDFMPRDTVDRQRWANVEVATQSQAGLPPIEVYQLDEVYFVIDGNHRVSVARRMGHSHIQAYVTEVRARVPVSPDMRPEDLASLAERTDFLTETELDRTRPQAELSVSELGQYGLLLEHISVHRYYMGLEQHHEINMPEAAAHWYDTIYLPVITIIRERGLLQDFPGRSETDLYLWVSKYHAELEEHLGKKIAPDLAASHLAWKKRQLRKGFGLSQRLFAAMLPEALEPGPPPGEWRREQEARRLAAPTQHERLFTDILVAVSGDKNNWQALEQAKVIAQREGSFINGLHVFPREKAVAPESETTLLLQRTFEQRCAEANLPGKLVLASGDVSRTICSYAAWSDLVVVTLSHPTGISPLARLGSGLLVLIQRCPRPILVVPQMVTRLENLLLAYDGSPKAREALYVATYLAGQWRVPLTVLTILQENKVTSQAAAEAETYLYAHGIQASHRVEHSHDPADIAPNILISAADCQADLIIMGGYGITPLQNVLQDTIVDQVLRRVRLPVLLCR